MPASSTQGTLIGGRYRVLRHLGSGGMASVLLCEDERLGRFVAVKRLHADSPDDVERRFVREAKLGASLNHPNLVSVFDTDTDDEGVLIVMEYVEGVSLAREVRRGPLTPDRVARMARELGAALEHAHAQGVVHRDVKPGNVLLRSDGVTKLVDLGIATAADNTRITHSGTVLGTAAYMAPEQLEGRAADAAADIYGMAAVCFEALCGERPRSGRTPMQIAHAIASGPAPDLLEHWPSAPRAAAATLRKGMARDPEDRHGSAGELAAELERALAGPAAVPTRPLRAATRTRRFTRRGNAAAAVGTAGAGTAAGAGGVAAGLAATTSARAAGGPKPSALVGGRGTRARPGAPGTTAGRSTRNRLPVIGLAAFIVAFAAAIAIAALASGGDDDPARSSAGAGAQREERAGAGGGESDRKGSKKDDEKKGEEQDSAESAPAPAAPAAPAPAEQPSSQPSPQPVSANPAQGATLNDQGFELMNAGRYEEAVPILQQAVESFPSGTDDITYAYALFNLGKSLRLAGRPEEAIPILERRLEIPNQTDVVQQELDAARRDAGTG